MTNVSWRQQFEILRQTFHTHRWLWVTPTILMTAVALAFAVWRPTQWSASQVLVVRDEAVGTTTRRGRFESSDSRKALQETILELARNPIVVKGALQTLNTVGGNGGKDNASDREVRSLQRKIKVAAPKGSEFGSSEVLYLSVLGPTPEAAVALANGICDQLERHLANLRNARASSVISELEETLNLALADLQQATDRLQAMEREVGSDLSELRLLNQSGAGEGNLRLALNQIKLELRQARTTFETQQQQHQLLGRARDNPDELLAAPSQFLESQPALRRLKDGLVDSQLRTSDLRGRMSPEHPQVQAAIRAEAEVRTSLKMELESALRSLSADLVVSGRQVETLQQQHDELQGRLDRLAGLRATYAGLVDDVQQRTAIVDQAKKDLADARASRSAAQSASLITRFQSPQASDSPVGPGRATIVAAGLLSGLLTGAGLVFLAAPLGSAPLRRRWTDCLPFGRRATDRPQTSGVGSGPPGNSLGRRTEDQPNLTHDRRQTRRRAEDRLRESTTADGSPKSARPAPLASPPDTFPAFPTEAGNLS